MASKKFGCDAGLAAARLVEIVGPMAGRSGGLGEDGGRRVLVVLGLAANACEGLCGITRGMDLKLLIAGSLEQAMEMVSEGEVACVLMHVRMLDAGVVERVESMRRAGVGSPIVVRAAEVEPEAALDVLQAGACEVMRERAAPEQMERVLRRVLDAESRERARRQSVREVEQCLSLLSDREFQVLRLMLSGLGNKQIAHELGLSVKTIESHRARVLAKLDAENIAQYAYRLLCSLV